MHECSEKVRVQVYHERPEETGLLSRWLHEGREVRVSSLVWAEFLCGPVVNPSVLEAFLSRPVAFEAEDAAKAARLFNQTGRRSRSLMDCMIAAIAIRAKADLATANTRDFQRFKEFGLRLAT